MQNALYLNVSLETLSISVSPPSQPVHSDTEIPATHRNKDRDSSLCERNKANRLRWLWLWKAMCAFSWFGKPVYHPCLILPSQIHCSNLLQHLWLGLLSRLYCRNSSLKPRTVSGCHPTLASNAKCPLRPGWLLAGTAAANKWAQALVEDPLHSALGCGPGKPVQGRTWSLAAASAGQFSCGSFFLQKDITLPSCVKGKCVFTWLEAPV